MEHANIGFDLLLADCPNRAASIAKELSRLNSTRQEVENSIFEDICHIIERDSDGFNRPSIVMGSETWHLGVLGIVASKLVQKYNKPAVLISWKGDTGKASGQNSPGHRPLQCNKTVRKFWKVMEVMPRQQVCH